MPISADKIGKIERGSLFGLRIIDKRTNEEMSIFFRSCEMIGFNRMIDLQKLQFTKGIFFYDLLSMEKKYQSSCGGELDMHDIKKHTISFNKMKELLRAHKPAHQLQIN